MAFARVSKLFHVPINQPVLLDVPKCICKLSSWLCSPWLVQILTARIWFLFLSSYIRAAHNSRMLRTVSSPIQLINWVVFMKWVLDSRIPSHDLMSQFDTYRHQNRNHEWQVATRMKRAYVFMSCIHDSRYCFMIAWPELIFTYQNHKWQVIKSMNSAYVYMSFISIQTSWFKLTLLFDKNWKRIVHLALR